MTMFPNQDRGNRSYNVTVKTPAKNKDCTCNTLKYFKEYNETTGIQGFRYITEQRSTVEKIFWIVVILLSLVGCIFMISQILDKYKNSPVVISFATEDTPLYQIPFPAITICPEARYAPSEEFNFTKTFLKLTHHEFVDPATLKKFIHLSQICDHDNVATLDNDQLDNLNETKFHNEVFKTIEDLRLKESSIFFACQDDSFNEIPCDPFFKPVLIDQGICYSYNILDRQEIFRDHVFHFSDYYKAKNKSKDNFDIETGYKEGVGAKTYPHRAINTGANNAIVITFNHNLTNSDFICNVFYQGYRVLVHNPWDVPRLSKDFFQVPLGKVVLAAMEPNMIVTSSEVRKFNPEKRKCYMKDERPLEHFQMYTQSNCLLECVTNYTLHKCGCVSFFMPRRNETPICGFGTYNCTDQAEEELKEKDIELKILGKSYCDCKPSCTNLKYRVDALQSDLALKEYYTSVEEDFDFDRTKMSVLSIYLKEEQFITTERKELYGISDLISNLGGLLGLFTGFSLISGIEIIYFCSLRWFCNKKLYGNWPGATN